MIGVACGVNASLVHISLKIRTVNTDIYYTMLTDFNVPSLHCIDVNDVRFQQDDATCHAFHTTTELLSQSFDGRLITRNGDIDIGLFSVGDPLKRQLRI